MDKIIPACDEAYYRDRKWLFGRTVIKYIYNNPVDLSTVLSIKRLDVELGYDSKILYQIAFITDEPNECWFYNDKHARDEEYRKLLERVMNG